MNEYDLMNLYFNFIFKDGNKSFRNVYASYEQLGEFKNWLTKQNIKFPFVHQIQKNECELLFRSKNFETYDTAFKTSYAHDFHKYIAAEMKKEWPKKDYNGTWIYVVLVDVNMLDLV